MDIDGVFIPSRMYLAPNQTRPVVKTFCPSVVGMVNDIAKRTGCRFVVHSSWVRSCFTDLGDMNVKQHMLSQGLNDHFHFDWATWYNPISGSFSRWDAINGWLVDLKDDTGIVADYIIIDDDVMPDCGLDKNRLINTNFDDGLTYNQYKYILDKWKE